MTDIVERLRRKLAPRMNSDEIEELWSEAVDEIERLRAALLDALTLCGVWEDDHPIKQRAHAALGENGGSDGR